MLIKAALIGGSVFSRFTFERNVLEFSCVPAGSIAKVVQGFVNVMSQMSKRLSCDVSIQVALIAESTLQDSHLKERGKERDVLCSGTMAKAVQQLPLSCVE